MIAPLRRRHRWMFLILALILAPLLTLALSGRSPVAPQQGPADGSGPAAAPSDGSTAQPFPELDAELQISDGTWVLQLREPLRKPDVLAYWSAEPPTAAGLPDGAYLLGSVSASRANTFEPPKPAASSSGHLILYSLGHQEIVASGPITGGAA